jgi:hypothetical protein
MSRGKASRNRADVQAPFGAKKRSWYPVAMRLSRGAVLALLSLSISGSSSGCARNETTPTSATGSVGDRAAPAPSNAPRAGAAAPSEDPTGCTRFWKDDDAVLRSHSMYEDVQLDRKTRTITEKVYTWPAARTARLTDAEFASLDAVLAGLCLPSVKAEPPPPPGGPMDVKVSGRAGEVRLGVKGTTGGDFLVLSDDQSKALFGKLKELSPESRGCLHFGPGKATITGKLLTTTRGSEGKKSTEKYPLVLLDSPVCVASDAAGDADPQKVMAGSIELVADHRRSVAPTLFDKRVTATGTLQAKKEGAVTQVILVVDDVNEVK